jgi:DNA mismatch repair ATPase MutS
LIPWKPRNPGYDHILKNSNTNIETSRSRRTVTMDGSFGGTWPTEGEEGGVDNDPELNVVINSFATICILNNIIGFAFYDEAANTIYADTVAVAQNDVEPTLASLKNCCSIALWLVHPKIVTNPGLLEAVTQGLDGTENYYRYKMLKSSYWNADAAADMILNKLIVDNRKMNYLWISTVVDMDCVQVRQALGAIILHMQLNSFQLDNGLVSVAAIKKLAVSSYMRIDDTSKKALQIFSQEFHPNVLKGKGKCKEGFSVLGLFDRTRSIPGRHMLRDWMKKPFFDKTEIIRRQDGIQFAIRSENAWLILELNKTFRKIHSVPVLLLRIRKAEASYKEWCLLYQSLRHCLSGLECLMEFINQDRHVDDVRWIRHLLIGLDVEICTKTFDMMGNCIDFVDSSATKSIKLLRGYDPILDQRCDIYDNLPQTLTETAEIILQMQPLLQTAAVEYVPQVGYLVAISSNEAHLVVNTQASRTDDWLNDDSCERTQQGGTFNFVYDHNGTHYFKHSLTHGMIFRCVTLSHTITKMLRQF